MPAASCVSLAEGGVAEQGRDVQSRLTYVLKLPELLAAKVQLLALRH